MLYFFSVFCMIHFEAKKHKIEGIQDPDAPTAWQVFRREWFYALMDYGVMLKKTIGNLNRKSRHYARQSAFAGSDRQLRGRILQLLLDRQTVERKDFGDLLEAGVRVYIYQEGLLHAKTMTVDRNLALITTAKERCRMCYTCVRECPAKAIRIVEGQADHLMDCFAIIGNE